MLLAMQAKYVGQLSAAARYANMIALDMRTAPDKRCTSRARHVWQQKNNENFNAANVIGEANISRQ